ncbi:MAG TPA: NAD-dependent epimerase/dehydratase family protein [Dehalococcoidia bacterium]|nr:NAD-dependent epimerase/dehydratase family protein [Dehalococcoidia bacterium]
MSVAVTGGTGFIGSHVVKKLVEQGRPVAVATDFAHLGMENLTGLGIRDADVEVRKADLTDYRQARTALSGVEVVFHLAAVVGSLKYLHGTETAELTTLQRNLAIDANLFRICLEEGVKKLVYASSCAVYPMDRQYSHGAVFREDDFNATNPDGGYGWSKLLGELQLGWTKNIGIGIARIFNAYGENEPLEEVRAHAIGDLTRKVVLSTQPELKVRGDGTQSRDFLYITDCADALLRVEEKASSPPLIVNIGSGRPTGIGTIAEKLVALSGKDIRLTYDLSQPTGPVSRTADMTKARQVLGWQPEVSLDDGLRQTYQWVKSRLGR